MNKELDIRKSDHIRLAFDSQTPAGEADRRFFYEPLLSGHPADSEEMPVAFGEKRMRYPLWISSMTGGTEAAYTINIRLAEVCARYGLGMGLGSCRPLLGSRNRWDDFNLRPLLGDEVPFFANLGIAQAEELLSSGRWEEAEALVEDLRADGLIVHVNPLQELLQPEGDRFRRSPLEVVEEVLQRSGFPIIVKEVGQGFGPASLEALLKLPLLAVDFGSFGGTNFSRLEQLRNPEAAGLEALVRVGHSAAEMLSFVLDIVKALPEAVKTRYIIFSGGIKTFLDGYFLIAQSPLPAVYGQASEFLRHASEGTEALDAFVRTQIKGLLNARCFLKPKSVKTFFQNNCFASEYHEHEQ